MTLFGFEIRLRPSPLRIVRGDEMSEEKLNEAVAVAETHPYRCAVVQLIATARDNAIQNAAGDMADPTTMAGYVGGGAHLLLLLEELENRRQRGLQAQQSKHRHA